LRKNLKTKLLLYSQFEDEAATRMIAGVKGKAATKGLSMALGEWKSET
jgi:hypothetical protein